MNLQPAERRTVLLGTHKTHALQIYYFVAQTSTGRQIILTDNPRGEPRSHIFPSPILPSHVNYVASIETLFNSGLITFYDHGKYFPGTLIPLSPSGIGLNLLKPHHDPVKLIEMFFFDLSKKMSTAENMRLVEAAFLANGWRINLQAATQARMEFEGGKVGNPVFAQVWGNALPLKVEGWGRNEIVDGVIGHKWLDCKGHLCLRYNPPGSVLIGPQQQQKGMMNVGGPPRQTQGNTPGPSMQQQRGNEQFDTQHRGNEQFDTQHPHNERPHNRGVETGFQQAQHYPRRQPGMMNTENKRKIDSPYAYQEALPSHRREHSHDIGNAESGSASQSQANKKAKTSHLSSGSSILRKEKRKRDGTVGFVDLSD